MIGQRLLSIGGSLSQQLETLWAQQSAEWPMLTQGIASLQRARTRDLDYGGSRIVAQFNPARMASTGAKIDAAAIKARPCFLCPANLPAEQKALPYAQRWLVLCNPIPIFEPHFVISQAEHEPQRVSSAIGVMLDLCRELANEYSIFYNGPKCGASAPDHIHLQAARTGLMPYERELLAEVDSAGSSSESWLRWVHTSAGPIGMSRPGRRPVIVLRSSERATLLTSFARTVELVGEIHPAAPEPMVNLLATYRGHEWVIFLFPRCAHRPASYGSGPGQFMISPGCADLGGVLIIPRTQDMDRLTPDIAGGVLEEVLFPPAAFARLGELL